MGAARIGCCLFRGSRKGATDMEGEACGCYHSWNERSTFPVEKRFYRALAAEERGHHLALLDSSEYFTDPAGWFVMKGHRLDGV